MLLNIVTDDELMVSQVVKGILITILLAGIIFNFFALSKVISTRRKIINGVLGIALLFAIFLAVKQFRIEQELLEHPVYAIGITTGYCQVFARGKGIEFEYQVDGKKYRNCNSFYPAPKDRIVVPGGKYLVRYSPKFQSAGRMDFSKPK